MKHGKLSTAGALALMAVSGTAFAASDYLLEIEGVKGETKGEIEIHSWSWGASNSGSAALSPRGGARVAAGDLNSDGRADLVVASTVPELRSFTVTLDGASATARRYCSAGQRLPNSRIKRAGTTVYDLKGGVVSRCAAGPRQTVSMTLTGQLRHTKTGHVTLLK